MPEVQLVREGREREEERDEGRGCVVEEFPGTFFLLFFVFFFLERSGATQLRFRVVVQLLRGGVVPPSSSPSLSFTNCNTEPERCWCQRFGCCCFFFLIFFFSFLFGERAGLGQCCGSFGRGGGVVFRGGRGGNSLAPFFLFFFVVSFLLNSHFSGL